MSPPPSPVLQPTAPPLEATTGQQNFTFPVVSASPQDYVLLETSEDAQASLLSRKTEKRNSLCEKLRPQLIYEGGVETTIQCTHSVAVKHKHSMDKFIKKVIRFKKMVFAGGVTTTASVCILVFICIL